jgi:beta-amylase
LRPTRLGLLALLLLAALASAGRTSFATPASPINVMAPLHVDDWQEFATQARHLKSIGVQAVSVDVWWGDVEKQRGRYDWSYYDKMFSTLAAASLKIVPIMSFHACGGNVGDTYTAPIPAWIWGQISGKRLNGVATDAENVKYRSEYGNASSQCVSLWADKQVLPIQHRFMQAFQSHFKNQAASIQEISISGGPAGELRFPSYDAHDGGRAGWPTRGALQAYSPLAQADFRRWALTKYRGLAGVNAAWGIQLANQQQIRPPDNGASFYDDKGYLTRYGRDLYDWYNESLALHAKRVVLNADSAFRGAFAAIPIGVKLPGVHWQMDKDAAYPRVAEMNAGLIPARSERDGEYNADNDHGYARIVGAIRDAERQLQPGRRQAAGAPRKLVLHFTCLEMNDDPHNGNSKAHSLATWVADASRRNGVQLKGENALPIGNPTGWANALGHLERDGYRGINILRMGRDLDTTALAAFIRSVPQASSEPPAMQPPRQLPRSSHSFGGARHAYHRTIRASTSLQRMAR